MPIHDIYSRRKKLEARAGEPEVYQYEKIPDTLRNQIIMILDDSLGQVMQVGYVEPAEAWDFIHRVLLREKGVPTLSGRPSPKDDCAQFVRRTNQIDDVLDVVEISFNVMQNLQRRLDSSQWRSRGIKQNALKAVEELNTRFREARVGYQFENGNIIRIDRQFIHAEVVRPTLNLLQEPMFEPANTEFLLAHEHYRSGRHSDAVVAALRAFESTMKCILTAEAVEFAPGLRATDLVKLVRKVGFLPGYLDAGFDSFIAMLKTGLPEVRNNAGGHGRAPDTPATPTFIASYAINTAATNIVLLVDAYKAQKSATS